MEEVRNQGRTSEKRKYQEHSFDDILNQVFHKAYSADPNYDFVDFQDILNEFLKRRNS